MPTNYDRVLNHEVPEGRKFTNRKGKLWLGDVPPPATPAKRPGNMLSVGGQRPSVFQEPRVYTGGAAMNKAAQTWVVSGIPVAGTIAVLPHWLLVNNIARRVDFQVVIQSGNTNAQITAAMKALLDEVLDNGAKTANSFVTGLGLADDLSHVKTALVDLYGSDPDVAFVVDNEELTLTVGANGTAGNNTSIGGFFLHCLPSPMPTEDANGVPQEPGFFCPGDFTEFNLANPTATVSYTPGNLGSAVVTPTVSTLSLDSGCFFNVSPEVLEVLQASNAVSNDALNKVIMFGAGSSSQVLRGKRISFIFDNDFGGFDRCDIWRGLFSELTLKYKIDAADAVPLKALPQPITSRVDQFGVLRLRY